MRIPDLVEITDERSELVASFGTPLIGIGVECILRIDEPGAGWHTRGIGETRIEAMVEALVNYKERKRGSTGVVNEKP